MKASELRIGNLLQGNPISNVNQGIYSDGVVAITGYGIHMMEIMGLDYKPIPLTEEWLVKFGFEIIRRSYYGNYAVIIDFQLWHGCDTDYWIFSTVDDRGDNNEVNVNLRFVHQLQNLYFALTGKELTI